LKSLSCYSADFILCLDTGQQFVTRKQLCRQQSDCEIKSTHIDSDQKEGKLSKQREQISTKMSNKKNKSAKSKSSNFKK
jgi:hypothetical protein